MEIINSIQIVGSIAMEPHYDHTVCGEAFYHIEVAAERLSGVCDVLPVTVSEKLIGEGGPEELALGRRVFVSGQVRSYNQRTGERSRLIITVFAKDIAVIPEDISPEEEQDPPHKSALLWDSSDKNEVRLSGAVCKPVVYRTTPFSREISDVLLAVNRRYGKSDYLPCIAWGRNARYAEGLSVGEPVFVSGRLQSRSYQKMLPDGTAEQRTAYEISCSSIERRYD